MAIDGCVSQLNSNGIVVSCTANTMCQKQGTKKCLLSVDHASRCQAWDIDKAHWLIDTDQTKIKQLPNN